METTKDVLSLAVGIGEVMLRNGAEIYRVEESVTRILQAYDITEFDVYVLSNGIFASANEDREDACSIIRHVPLGSTNLAKITLLNQLTRDICNRKCSIDEAWGRLMQYDASPAYGKWVQILCCGLGSGGFGYLFGGKPIDAAFAFLIGLLLQPLLFAFSKAGISKVLKNLFASMFVSFMTIALLQTGLPLLADKIIIGSVMPLVPGIAFTTSIRDISDGDYLSGTIHLIDALLTALCIALGVCLPIAFLRFLGGGIILP